jgi:hypothetical protein
MLAGHAAEAWATAVLSAGKQATNGQNSAAPPLCIHEGGGGFSSVSFVWAQYFF